MMKKQTLTLRKERMRGEPIEFVVIGESDHGRPVRKLDCSGSIGSRVVTLLAEAVEQVSSGDMAFSVRNLFYAVRELHGKRFTGCKFYKTYDGFSQDFLRAYEKVHGKISGLTRMSRGKYLYPEEEGNRREGDIKPGMWFNEGCANKVIMVEKEGLYTMMKANKFDVRLDAVLAYTSGFTTEAGRNMLIEAQRRGLDVTILRDYDVAGILIYSTLTKPTKRLDTYLDEDKLYDLGLNWGVIQEIREYRSLTPEPVKLNKSHTTALGNMLDRGEISGEEYDLLHDSRIELNQLTPKELLEWLEKRLEDLGLWKTIPEQGDLDDALNGHIDESLKEKVSDRATKLEWTILEVFGVKDIYEKLLNLAIALSGKSKEEVRDLIDELEFPEMTVTKLEKMLREDPMRYWTVAMKSEAEGMVNDLNEEIDGDLKKPGEAMMKRIKEERDVKDTLAAVKVALEEWSSER